MDGNQDAEFLEFGLCEKCGRKDAPKINRWGNCEPCQIFADEDDEYMRYMDHLGGAEKYDDFYRKNPNQKERA